MECGRDQSTSVLFNGNYSKKCVCYLDVALPVAELDDVDVERGLPAAEAERGCCDC